MIMRNNSLFLGTIKPFRFNNDAHPGTTPRWLQTFKAQQVLCIEYAGVTEEQTEHILR